MKNQLEIRRTQLPLAWLKRGITRSLLEHSLHTRWITDTGTCRGTIQQGRPSLSADGGRPMLRVVMFLPRRFWIQRCPRVRHNASLVVPRFLESRERVVRVSYRWWSCAQCTQCRQQASDLWHGCAAMLCPHVGRAAFIKHPAHVWLAPVLLGRPKFPDTAPMQKHQLVCQMTWQDGPGWK